MDGVAVGHSKTLASRLDRHQNALKKVATVFALNTEKRLGLRGIKLAQKTGKTPALSISLTHSAKTNPEIRQNHAEHCKLSPAGHCI